MNEQTLPSRRKLLTSTCIALVIAGAILVTIVLPAEYGTDPTKMGGLLGLTAMGESKADAPPAVVSRAAAIGATPVMHAHESKYHSARVEIRVEGNEELEYKAVLAKGEPLLYAWTVQGGPLYSEFHGEPSEGEWPEGYYQSYQIAESSEAERGSFIAPFTGHHGWYWRNPGAQPVTITLEASGYYSSLGRVGSSAAAQ